MKLFDVVRLTSGEHFESGWMYCTIAAEADHEGYLRVAESNERLREYELIVVAKHKGE